MINVKNLTKVFGEKTAVNDLSFEVEAGEIVGFLGPNAAGKTTTMRMLTGYFPPTSGTAEIAGLDVVEKTDEVRRLVGYLPEHVPLYMEMTPREFLGFAASAKKVPKAQRKEAVEKALERCNLGPVAHQLIGTLSRGYRQRVGLGQAIINDPKVLILDEPTVGLDPAQVRDIRALLRQIAQDSTAILPSHIMSEVSQMCSRAIIIFNGAIQGMDTPDTLAAALESETRVALRVSGAEEKEVEEALQALEIVSTVQLASSGLWEVSAQDGKGEELAPSLASEVVGKGWKLHELKPKAADLEDVFIQLVESEKKSRAQAPKAKEKEKDS